jgi:hypothetical protein
VLSWVKAGYIGRPTNFCNKKMETLMYEFKLTAPMDLLGY